MEVDTVILRASAFDRNAGKSMHVWIFSHKSDESDKMIFNFKLIINMPYYLREVLNNHNWGPRISIKRGWFFFAWVFLPVAFTPFWVLMQSWLRHFWLKVAPASTWNHQFNWRWKLNSTNSQHCFFQYFAKTPSNKRPTASLYAWSFEKIDNRRPLARLSFIAVLIVLWLISSFRKLRYQMFCRSWLRFLKRLNWTMVFASQK